MLLPQPLSPTSPSVSPADMQKLTPSTALSVPRVRENIPRCTGKCMQRLETSRSCCGDRLKPLYSITPSTPWQARKAPRMQRALAAVRGQGRRRKGQGPSVFTPNAPSLLLDRRADSG